MVDSFSKMTKHLKKKLFPNKKEEKEENLFKEYVQEAINCFVEDFLTKKQKNRDSKEFKSKLEKALQIKDLSNQEYRLAIEDKIRAIRYGKGIPELNVDFNSKELKVLADYFSSAISLYEYSLAIPSYDLAIKPAIQTLADNLVSLSILPEKKMDGFIKKLEQKLKDLSHIEQDIDVEEQIKNVVDEVCRSGEFKEYFIKQKKSNVIDEVNINKAKELVTKTFLDRNRNATYGKEEYRFSLANLLQLALNQYQDLYPIIEPHRQKNIAELSEILNKHKEDPVKLTESFKSYINDGKKFTRAIFGSKLKELCMHALNHYATKKNEETNMVHRVIQVKDYNPEIKENNLEKNTTTHVLAIHGLEDSLKTWEVLAQKWLEEGYCVHTYDQVGHGLDEARRQKGKPELDPIQMYYDLHSKIKHVLEQKPKKLLITAHSFGGALVANSLCTLNKLQKEYPETIIEVNLITPATMKLNIFSLLSKVGEDISSEVKVTRKLGPSRQGGIRLWGQLGNFIRFLARAFDNLRHYMAQEGVPIHVHEAGQDKKVENPSLKIGKGTIKPIHSFYTHKDAGHNLHQESEHASAIATEQKKTK